MLKITLILIGLLCMQQLASAQIETLFQINAAAFDSAGFVTYSPGSTRPGEPWAIYLATHAADGDDNGLMLLESAEDQMIHVQHQRYQQTYKGLPVEGAVWKEHVQNGYLVFANGMLATNMHGSPTSVPSEAEALSQILLNYPQNIFAWMVDAMEVEIKADLGDSTATNHPQGELLWALDNYAHLGYRIPGSRYRLAWKFEMESVFPAFYKAIFVDAITGQVFREDDLELHNGFGDTWYHGTQPIDTKWAGATSKFILWADDNGRNIHTKKNFNVGSWALGTNYRDQDNTWDSTDIEGTSTHWFAAESWDFFASPPYSLNIDSLFDHKELRVWTNLNTVLAGGSYSYEASSSGFQYLVMDAMEEKAIDIVGHEFCHRIQQHREAANYLESGALKESFGDIFGTLIEARTEGMTNWTHGSDPGTVLTRNLKTPKTDGDHFTNSQCSTMIGQPSTYLGEYWYSDTICDRGGVHTNDGVQNYWFYLLSEGGSGVNDNLDSFSVQGIGIDNAARITYYNMMNILSNADGYEQARAGGIRAATLLFGSCSAEEIQTTNAWSAVGLGSESNCLVRVDPLQLTNPEKISVYPNPSNGNYTLDIVLDTKHVVEVRTIVGVLVKRFEFSGSHMINLDLQELPNGTYFTTVVSKAGTSTFKCLKI